MTPLNSIVADLRSQGLADTMIADELRRQGYSDMDITKALDSTNSGMSAPIYPMAPSQQPSPSMPDRSDDSTIYSRIEEIAEGLIDEKWDELVAEVKKILVWKERVEARQQQLEQDITHLKDNFKLLHEGVLGKLESYDQSVRDVRTELKAVGKVFHDVIPQFVDNVKELSSITEQLKKK